MSLIRKIKALFKSPTPAIDKIYKEIKELERKGVQELDYTWNKKIMMAALNDLAPTMARTLFGDEKAENFLIIRVDNDNPDYTFNIILHKSGKKLPSPDVMWRYGGVHPDQVNNK